MGVQHPPVPDQYDPGAFPPFAVTVDIVVLTIEAGELKVLLVQRGGDPYRGSWALPGGFVRPDEDLDAAAQRELSEETGVEAAGHLEQLRTYGTPDRDPRMRVVSVAYLAFLRRVGPIAAGTDAESAALVPIRDLLAEPSARDLAFDHLDIVKHALARTRERLASTSLATALVGPEFTLAELRGVYEAAWDQQVNPANFRRKILGTRGFVKPTGRTRTFKRGTTAPEIYTAGDTVELSPPLQIEPTAPRPSMQPRSRRQPPPRNAAVAYSAPPIDSLPADSFPPPPLDDTVALRRPRPVRPQPDSAARVWRIRAWDDSELQGAMLEDGVIAIGGTEIGDLSGRPGDQEIGRRLRDAAELADRSDAAISRFVAYWRAFLDDIQVGDYLLVPLARRRVAVGRIADAYRYRSQQPNPRLRHTRPVEWLLTLHRDSLDNELRKRVDAPGTIARVHLTDATARVEALLTAG